MNMGNLSGLVNGTEQVVFDYEVTGSAVSSISTGNILNGDEDGWYTIIFRLVSATDVNYITLNLNGDTGGNYGYRGIGATNTTVANNSGTGGVAIYLTAAGATNTNEHGFGVARIYAKSGAVRLVNFLACEGVSGTTVTSLSTEGAVWNNTADNLISMLFSAYVGNGLGIGTRIIILKSNNFTGGTPTGSITTPYIKGSWVRVGSQVLGSAATTVSFTGLDGDRDVVYRLFGQWKVVNADTTLKGYFNSDTSATTYGYQLLDGANTTVSAARNTYAGLFLGGADATQLNTSFEALIFAKQGFIRPVIICCPRYINGTTIYGLYVFGMVWNNTNTNITQLDLTATVASNIAAGSQFDLYALRPAG